MAWNDNTAAVLDTDPNGGNSPNGGGNGRNFEKAVGFLNLSLTGPDGKPVKFGFVALKASDPQHVKILNWIDKHGAETVCEKIAGDMSLDYNPNQKKERGLALDELFG